MKSSLIAMTAALALSIGGSAALFAQEAVEAPTTLNDCLVQEGAGSTAPGDSLATETNADSNDSQDATDNPPAQGLAPAVGDEVTCPGTDDSAE
ncbi:hypothetical protein DevBK_14695 [Devosia sp. BK]|uniref:hypothetical protein n=1 Tax=Devosia sp. BK TaxID=2871706 RepID=UPI00293B3B37|nr:hypothetical protein [Devosia sp. BK]MDV3252586.1 hypothetical protein [Devosia sp. BK]